ncbi:MAG TPA: SusC/RagA family TonB-linked outer membrane protein, partial [Flavitalea sp.]|nr:SusC/RagA family TonB-linked outer membrane protein [Flavitalea sp.]
MRSTCRLLLVFCLIQCSFTALAQRTLIVGKVTAEDGVPVSGASITLKGSTRGVSTGENGSFSISLPGGSGELTISAIGFEPKNLKATSGAVMDIKLVKSVTAFTEVVVTALGIKRDKRQLTYSTQELKGNVITSTKEPSVLNALAGRVSGVQITSSSGQPGSSTRIVIRGATSITGNNEALIVMDGIPINNSQTGNAGPGNGISRLSDIDPDIIESINVLKGSAASALYGSDAARGVVIITTKSGSANRKPQISFTSQYSIEQPILTDVQDKYAQGTNGVFSNGNNQKTSEVWGPLIDTLRVNGAPVFYQNPLKAFFKNGSTFTNTVSVGGGVGKSNYFFSYSNLTQKGTAPTSTFNRHVAFAKFTTAISPVFTTNFQFNYTNTSSNRIPEGNDIISPLWTVYTAPFTWDPYPIYDSSGVQRVFRLSRNNPYWSIDNSYNKSKNNRFIPTFSVVATPFNWLTITERVGADIYSEQNKYYESPSTILASTGRIEDRSNNFRQFNHDLIIEAKKKFGSDFDVSFLVGNNAFDQTVQNYNISGSGITILGFDNISNAATVTSSQSTTRRRKLGFYAQSNIEYRRLLNLSLTGRYDGTSVLSEGQNFYPYGSASVNFIFSELFKNIPA